MTQPGKKVHESYYGSWHDCRQQRSREWARKYIPTDTDIKIRPRPINALAIQGEFAVEVIGGTGEVSAAKTDGVKTGEGEVGINEGGGDREGRKVGVGGGLVEVGRGVGMGVEVGKGDEVGVGTEVGEGEGVGRAADKVIDRVFESPDEPLVLFPENLWSLNS